jgi:hypothetical protein
VFQRYHIATFRLPDRHCSATQNEAGSPGRKSAIGLKCFVTG